MSGSKDKKWEDEGTYNKMIAGPAHRVLVHREGSRSRRRLIVRKKVKGR